jgi:hypothetical protein
MLKWLIIGGVGLLVLSVIMLVGGLTSQQPVGFALSILCGFPFAMFFLGGAFFSFLANYQITPKALPDVQRGDNRARQPRARNIG